MINLLFGIREFGRQLVRSSEILNPAVHSIDMFPYLLLLLIAMPLIELWLLLRIGGEIGAVNTFLLVLITGVIGAALAKQQGLKAWHDAHSGKNPGAALADGVMILIAGCLLMTPGIITDVFGFLLLLPPFRALVRKNLKNRIRVQAQVFGTPPGTMPDAGPTNGSWPESSSGSTEPGTNMPPDVIDVEHQPHDS